MKRESCPKCHCKAYIKQGYEKTKYKGNEDFIYKERRKCKYCGTRYTVKPKERNNPLCPYCGNEKTRKEGFSNLGVQKYYCPSCKKHFQNKYKNGKTELYRISEHNRKMIVKYHTGGFSNKFIAKLLGVGETSVKRILDKHNMLLKIGEEADTLQLTKTEHKIYKILRTTNKVITTQDLLSDANTDKSILRVHIHNLRSKLRHSNIPYTLLSVYGKGYTLGL